MVRVWKITIERYEIDYNRLGSRFSSLGVVPVEFGASYHPLHPSIEPFQWMWRNQWVRWGKKEFLFLIRTFLKSQTISLSIWLMIRSAAWQTRQHQTRLYCAATILTSDTQPRILRCGLCIWKYTPVKKKIEERCWSKVLSVWGKSHERLLLRMAV